MTEQYERQVAFKVKVSEILEGNYVVEEGWKPNYLLTKLGKKVSRVNLIGVVLDKEDGEKVVNLVLDDGSGKIKIRSFEEMKGMSDVGVGEGVLVVGKIRVYNDEKYVSPEIVKKVEGGWLKLRALELGREEVREEMRLEVKERGEEKVKGEEFLDSGGEGVLEVIKELDKGEGALIEEVVEKLGPGGEEKIDKMLEKGEIFQNVPGRVKVL